MSEEDNRMGEEEEQRLLSQIRRPRMGAVDMSDPTYDPEPAPAPADRKGQAAGLAHPRRPVLRRAAGGRRQQEQPGSL